MAHSVPRHPARRSLIVALAALPIAGALGAQDLPRYLRDRGTGMATSMFGTYVNKGELLVYTFAEWYQDRNLEYKPSEFGHGLGQDFRGSFEASEKLLFFSYGLTPNLSVELEGAYMNAELEKSRLDPSSMPGEVSESGLGDVEGQLRWRFQRETERRPEGFAYFETVFPLQRRRQLIGTQQWEFALGAGFTRGFSWGTMTFRTGAEYSERKVEVGEYALEYLKRLSPSWRVAALVEGSQLDEVAFITEVQYRVTPRLTLKLNNGWGLTPNATDIAPEFGLLFSLGRR